MTIRSHRRLCLHGCCSSSFLLYHYTMTASLSPSVRCRSFDVPAHCRFAGPQRRTKAAADSTLSHLRHYHASRVSVDPKNDNDDFETSRAARFLCHAARHSHDATSSSALWNGHLLLLRDLLPAADPASYLLSLTSLETRVTQIETRKGVGRPQSLASETIAFADHASAENRNKGEFPRLCIVEKHCDASAFPLTVEPPPRLSLLCLRKHWTPTFPQFPPM